MVRDGTRLFTFGLFVLIVQCVSWIEQGHWTPCSLREVLHWLGSSHPSVGWYGAQAVVDGLLAIPLSALPIALGFMIAWNGAAKAEGAKRILDAEPIE